MNCETIHARTCCRAVCARPPERRGAALVRRAFLRVRTVPGTSSPAAGLCRRRRRNSSAAVVLQLPRRRWMAWGAAAAMLLAGVGLVELGRQKPAASPAPVAASSPQSPAPLQTLARMVQTLARVQPPVYTPRICGAQPGTVTEVPRSDGEVFRRGLRGGALALRGMVAGGLETASARFYLSIADLMTGTVQEPVTLLRSIDAMGETPYLEHLTSSWPKRCWGIKTRGRYPGAGTDDRAQGRSRTRSAAALEKVRALPGRQ